MPDTTYKGVLAEVWAHWQKLGLTADLLPVVSDTATPLHEKSKLTSLGKVPSQITSAGYAVGIPEWTSRHATTDKDIGRWLRDTRHGICLRTGNIVEVCALDGDIADKAFAAEVRAFIELIVGRTPVRYRNDSGKFAMLFKVRGVYRKRIITTRGGNIEWLAKGQQLIIGGTHPSGARYEWEGGLPEEIPELSPVEFEALWSALQAQFGVEPEVRERSGLVRPAVPRAPNATIDDVTNFLEGNQWVRSWTNDGRVNITCPFESEHTTSDIETATQYFPAGVGGFALGHFKCLHAHCAGRNDSDFLDAIGYMDGEFEDLVGTAVTAPDGTVTTIKEPPPPAPNYQRTRNGEVLATISNLAMALARDDQCGMRIAWDNFKDEIVWASPGNAMDWRPFRDHDYVQLRIHLLKPMSQGGANFKEIGRELIRDAVHYVAMHNQMDSATMWAESLVWDGVPRVREFFSTYFRAVNNPYTRAVSMYTWTALAGRALVPGIKADMAIILKSEQGTVKTEGIKSMAPHADAFGEIDLGKGDDVLARQTRGKLVCEISELKGLNSREHGAIKSWVSRTHEEWVPKFKEFATKFPRRFICLGTTNEDEFLADSTGERRWLPMKVGRTDLDALKRDCEQLWAEGVHIFRTQGGVQWKDAETLAKREHAQFKVQDSWHDVVVAWLNEEAFGDVEGVRQGDYPLRVHHVLQSALRVNLQNITRRDELRVTQVLRAEGYEPTTVRAKGEVFRAWVHQERLDAARELREAASDIG